MGLLSPLAVLVACAPPVPIVRGPAPSIGTLQVGINAHSMYDSVNCRSGARCVAGGLAARAADLDAVRATGAGWVRIDFGWVNSEPDRAGQLDRAYQARTRSVVRDAHTRGLRVLAMVWASPGWASGSRVRPTEENGLSKLPPDDRHLADYARFLAAFVTRSRVDAVEVWNEPNLRAFWNESDPSDPSLTTVGRYARLLELAGQAVHRATKGTVPVIGGAVARADDRWLAAMYDWGSSFAGGADAFRRSFDALSVHPYPDPSDGPPSTPDRDPARQNLAHIDAVRSLMERVGDGAKPVWVTELGWSTNQSCVGRDELPGVTERDQASYLSGALTLLAARPWVKAAFWYDIRDDGTDSCAHEDGFGLVRRGGDRPGPKPAFDALRQMLRPPRG